jgi:hypothetical protein
LARFVFLCARFALALLNKIVQNHRHKKTAWVDTEKGSGWIMRTRTLRYEGMKVVKKTNQNKRLALTKIWSGEMLCVRSI